LWYSTNPNPGIYHSAITLRDGREAPAVLRELSALVASRRPLHSLCDSWASLGGLEFMGMGHSEAGEWYVRRPAALRAAAVPTALAIEKVTTPAALREFEVTSLLGFGTQVPQVPFRIHAPAILVDPNMHVLAGRVGGRMVSAAMAYVSDGLVGIFGVATLPEFRRRGYGGALTRAAIAVAPGLPSMLQPSRMAAAMYHRLGFRSVGQFTNWSRLPLH
jgi:GNAT superfamily N-acetyltransferase